MAYTIAPYSSFGGQLGEQTLIDAINNPRTPHMTWMEKIRTAIDFITADNTLICIANSPFKETVTSVTPLGLTQSFNWGEDIPSVLMPEVGSRRKRLMVGSSQGGQASISKMTVIGDSVLKTMYKHGETMGLDSTRSTWTEKEWVALIGLNHDLIRNAFGLVVIEAGPDSRNYSAYMLEQCGMQGQSRGYAAGQHLVVDNLSFIFEQTVPLWSIASDPGYSSSEVNS